MLLTAVSLVIAAVSNPLRVLRRVWPYVAVLVSFAAFVACNGGVVLGEPRAGWCPEETAGRHADKGRPGDKTNHVATIHLAQMLYIWPFFAFFSLPLLLPSIVVLANALGLAAPFPARTPSETPRAPGLGPRWKRLVWLVYVGGTLALSALVVRLNTIVHPFTLADNRHYMFYVFRYTIRRAAWVRYALIAPYTLSRWLVWGATTGWPVPGGAGEPAAAGGKPRPGHGPAEAAAPPGEAPATSTVLIFLVATSLSLVTAPLVEPRYFIVPWVVWRLLVPAWRQPRYDVRLVAETAWFAAVNAATCYVFVAKPYVWRADDGSVLDGGRLQRFMW